MKNKTFRNIVFVFFVCLFSFVSVGRGAYVVKPIIQGEETEETEATYNPSSLTTHLDSLSSGSEEFFFDDTRGGDTYIANPTPTNNTYISSDTANFDSTNRVIPLGYKDQTLTLEGNAHFTHTGSNVNYSTSSVSSFSVGNDNEANYFTYYSSQNNANNGTVTNYRMYSGKTVNYYWTGGSVNDYIPKNADGTGGGYTTKRIRSGRLYTIKLVGDVTIASGSTLSIGALIGSTATGVSGAAIQGAFVCLDLNGHTLTVSSGATLNAYGYIIDSKLDSNGNHVGQIICNGTINAGFVVEDYSGGTQTVGRAWVSAMPFSHYSIPYLSCKTVFNYGSALNALTMLYASSELHSTTFNMIGTSNSMFTMSSGSKIVRDSYNDGNNSTTALFNANYKCNWILSGTIAMTSLTLVLDMTVTASLNMAQYRFHVPSYYHFTLESCNLTLPYVLEFSPGSSLYVDSASTINLTSTSYDNKATFIINISIAKGTAYGGIVVPTQIIPDNNSTSFRTTYVNSNGGNSTINLYAITRNNFDSYETAENSILSGTSQARIRIDGRITGTVSGGNHQITGYIQFSDNALSSIRNHISNINTFTKAAQTMAVSNNSVSGDNKVTSYPDDVSNPGFIIQPLVDASTGQVINVSDIDGYSGKLTEGSTTYDFRSGIYTVGSNKYVYLTNNSDGSTSGSLTQISQEVVNLDNSGNIKNRYIVIGNSYYIYYRDQFVPSVAPDSSSTLTGTYYVRDNSYSGQSTGNYYQISNDTFSYTIQKRATDTVYTGNGSTTVSRTRTRTRSRNNNFSSWGSWSAYSAWSSWNTTLSNLSYSSSGTSETNYAYETRNDVQVVSYTIQQENNWIVDVTKFSRPDDSYILVGKASVRCEYPESTETEYRYTGNDSTPTLSSFTSGGDFSNTQTETQTQAVAQSYFQKREHAIAAGTWKTTLNIYSLGSGSLKYDSSLGVWVKGSNSP